MAQLVPRRRSLGCDGLRRYYLRVGRSAAPCCAQHAGCTHAAALLAGACTFVRAVGSVREDGQLPFYLLLSQTSARTGLPRLFLVLLLFVRAARHRRQEPMASSQMSSLPIQLPTHSLRHESFWHTPAKLQQRCLENVVANDSSRRSLLLVRGRYRLNA